MRKVLHHPCGYTSLEKELGLRELCLCLQWVSAVERGTWEKPPLLEVRCMEVTEESTVLLLAPLHLEAEGLKGKEDEGCKG